MTLRTSARCCLVNRGPSQKKITLPQILGSFALPIRARVCYCLVMLPSGSMFTLSPGGGTTSRKAFVPSQLRGTNHWEAINGVFTSKTVLQSFATPPASQQGGSVALSQPKSQLPWPVGAGYQVSAWLKGTPLTAKIGCTAVTATNRPGVGGVFAKLSLTGASL